jgi:hypothetical protein
MKLTRLDWNWFGKARKANIQKESTTIIDGNGEEAKVNNRIEELKLRLIMQVLLLRWRSFRSV